MGHKLLWKSVYKCRHFFFASVLNNNIIIRQNIGSRENLLLLQERYFMVPMRLALVRCTYENIRFVTIVLCTSIDRFILKSYNEGNKYLFPVLRWKIVRSIWHLYKNQKYFTFDNSNAKCSCENDLEWKSAYIKQSYLIWKCIL